MSKYDINIRQLGLLLLPTFLRQPLMASLLYAALTPLAQLHMRLTLFRRETAYRLDHNGQVCHLRAVLNDTFDPDLRRITVTDTAQSAGVLLVRLRAQAQAVRIPRRHAAAPLAVNRRGFGGASGYEFVVNLPLALRGSAESRLTAVANTYKLASKRFAISYF